MAVPHLCLVACPRDGFVVAAVVVVTGPVVVVVVVVLDVGRRAPDARGLLRPRAVVRHWGGRG